MSRGSTAHVAAPLLALGLLVLLAASARAEIYHYVDRDGNHIFTTYRVRGMQLVEVIEGPASSARPSDDDDDGAPSAPRARSGQPTRRAVSAQPRFDPNAFDPLIREAAAAFELPFEFIKAVIRAESAFNPRAVSRAGAQGLMQLMPGTAADMGVSDPFDPRENIEGGTRYLRYLADQFEGDINLVLSAYNAGPGRVAEYDGIPYEATRRYVQSVYRYYQEYLAAATN
jgi:hypothetical protein